MAAAAAIFGLTRWVRPPRPWRPSKLRFEVEAQRSPGSSVSGFIPRHIEQPAERQSKPAARKTSSSPSDSACALTCAEPGHDHRTDRRGDLAALDQLGGLAQVADPRVGAGADEDAVERDLLDRRPGLQAHVLERALVALALGLGHGAGDVGDHRRVGAPADLRRQLGGVDHHLAVELGAVLGVELAPAGDGGVEVLGRRLAAPDPLERRVVGRDHPGAAAALDRHVADGHPALHRERLDRRAGVLDHVADAAVDAHPADRAEDQVLGGDAGAELALVADAQRLRLALLQRLGRQHVLDLAGADAERERAERAVGRGVRVAADDRHARLGDAQLRADHVDDALARGADRVDRHAELARSCPRASRSACATAGRRSSAGSVEPSVGTLWSAVASVRSGRRTVRPASRRLSNACGLVTSWTRWRSM